MPGCFVTCTSDTVGIVGSDASQAQLQLLLAELKRIEGQQQQLKTAAAENKVLIVHPVKGFDLDEEDEYAEEVVAKPDPDKFVPSGQHTAPLLLAFLLYARCCKSESCCTMKHSCFICLIKCWFLHALMQLLHSLNTSLTLESKDKHDQSQWTFADHLQISYQGLQMMHMMRDVM